MSAATAQSGACPDGELGAAVAPLLSPPPGPLAACAVCSADLERQGGGHGAGPGNRPTPTLRLVPSCPLVGKAQAVVRATSGPALPQRLFVKQSWAQHSGIGSLWTFFLFLTLWGWGQGQQPLSGVNLAGADS